MANPIRQDIDCIPTLVNKMQERKMEQNKFMDPADTSNGILKNELNRYDNDTLLKLLNGGQGIRVKTIVASILREREMMGNINPTGPMYNVSGTYAPIGGMNSRNPMIYGNKASAAGYMFASGNENYVTNNEFQKLRNFANSSPKDEDDDIILTRNFDSLERKAEQLKRELSLRADMAKYNTPLNSIKVPTRVETPKVDLTPKKPKEPSKALLKSKEALGAIKTSFKKDITDPFLSWLRK